MRLTRAQLRACGLEPTPARNTIASYCAPADLLPPGTVLAEGVVPGRAAPWCAPAVSRNGGSIPTPSRQRMKNWQETVRLAVTAGRRPDTPYGGPVDVALAFYLRSGGSQPDRDNLVKSTVDALQGVVFTNDRLVRGGECRLVLVGPGEPERVEYRVTACEPDGRGA
jgi:Holliday junction resolvase RusA-like endonuclease